MTSQLNWQTVEDDPNNVDRALKTMKDFFATGQTKSYQFRVDQLNAFKRGVQEMTAELSEALTKDLGRSDFINKILEISSIVADIDHTLANLQKWMQDEPVDTPSLLAPAKCYVRREPLGVIAIMGSWNFPLFTSIHIMVSALAAGNCILVKPSEMSVNSAHVIHKLITKYMHSKAVICVNGAVQTAIRLTSSKFD